MPPMRARTTAALVAFTAALSTAPAVADEWKLAQGDDRGWTRIEQTTLGALSAALPAAEPFAGTRAAWQREWLLLEARMVSLGLLPVDVALQARAALRGERAPSQVSTLAWLRGEPQANETDAQAGARPAIQIGHARSSSATWPGVHFWAGGAGYAVGRRSAGYGIKCGAALPLDKRVDLTAGYRLAGYALGDRLDPELSDVDERVATPFVGLDVRF